MATKKTETIIKKFLKKAGEAEVDVFQATDQRYRLLRSVSSTNGGQGDQGPATSGNETMTQRRKREVLRSQFRPIEVLRNCLAMEGSPDQGNASNYTGKAQLTSPMAFLARSPHGLILREALMENPAIANKVIERIVHGANSMSRAMGFSNELMIARPFHAYVDQRQTLLDRVSKTESFMQLIQKQERLLQRIGTTSDATLAMSGGDASYTPALELFKTLWTAHIAHMGTDANTIRHTAPPVLTCMLFETLILTCDSTITLSVVTGDELYPKIEEIYPAKGIIRELRNNAQRATTASYFV